MSEVSVTQTQRWLKEFNTAKRDLKHEIERLRRLDEGFADELTVFAGEENLDEDWDANTEHPNENPEILDSKIRVSKMR